MHYATKNMKNLLTFAFEFDIINMLGVCKDTLFRRKKRGGLPPRFYLLFHFLFLIINYKICNRLCNKCNTPRDCIRMIQPFGSVELW